MTDSRAKDLPVYPPTHVNREGAGAPIVSVAPDSPADDAGFSAGCYITHIDGNPVCDIIDWRWLSAGDEMEVGYIDTDGDAGSVVLERDPGEDWGFSFDGMVFDGIKQCRNACIFCFMRMLPAHMRPSLSVRDDDFRLSFLAGTFVTLTNLSAEDEARIIEQRISPLRVSLHAVDEDVRQRIMGKHAAHGLAAFERLLAAGIKARVQIVLMPGENDGEVLKRTLEWAYARPNIIDVGVVPLGFTKYQTSFSKSFNDSAAALRVLADLRPFQERAMRERGNAWVFASDEFYRNAYGETLLDNLPPTSFYGDFELFEDGIGIVRTCVDEWERAKEDGVVDACAVVLRKKQVKARLVCGEALREVISPLVARYGIEDCISPLFVKNDFFGGNVDVTGLLTGQDIAKAVRRDSQESMRTSTLYCVPRIVFNDDNVTFDDWNVEDMEDAAGIALAVVSLNPIDYLREIAELAQSLC